MEGGCPAVMTGVQGDEQLDHLRAAKLPDHETIWSHAQRLPHQFAKAYRSSTFNVGRPRRQADHVRVTDG